ncbi:hypothetical protein [Hymenobacter psychrotolerans]|uniref:TIGR04222 domain-containing protein n=1 Tax=Hymenobacter psychrotolerans DSM 18569 TaxID=1121959 RepID=A0A1M6W7N3_9BACT|nr:hypothetical protein [Hymenobacter psychrotolerans]SHK89648.1 hypothetical protein SAMN02746009_01770 [Hymenobacter psychrotolerans DSM 18569]
MAPEIKDFLAQARPTELLLLLADRTPPLLQQLRLTFLDLLRQQVLLLENRVPQPPQAGAAAWATYVRPGPALPHYRPRAYEALLLQPFLKKQLPEVLLRHYVRMTFRAAESNERFARIVQLPGLLPTLYATPNWWQRLLGIKHLTPAGDALLTQVRAWLVEQDISLNRLAQQNIPAATAQVAQLGGLLFLLPTFRSPLGHALDQELYRAQYEHYQAVTTISDSAADTHGPSSWYHCGHHFDSHIDGSGHDDSGDAGCGTASGCGGDSGCGGCGSGCGGD